jgi:hypothetical protein
MKSQCCLLLLFLFFTSCATITRGIHEKLTVQSDPPAADVKLSTGEHSVTPAKFVKHRRTESFTVTISKPGYVSQTVKVESKASATGGTVMAANVLAGVVGIAVDASTGAYDSLYPNPISVRLTPVPLSKPLKPRKTSATPTAQRALRNPARPSHKEKTAPPVSPKAKPTPTPQASATPAPTPASTPPPAQPSPTPAEPPTLESVPNPDTSPSP